VLGLPLEAGSGRHRDDCDPQAYVAWRLAEHMNLTGDYVWLEDRLPVDGRFRPLGMGAKP